MEEFSSNKSTRPIAIVSQLLQLITSMHHIDDLFAWLAATMVEHFNMLSVQIWAVQASRTGSVRRKLRASSSRHSSQAINILESVEVKVFVERMLRERRGILSIPVVSTFSRYQATIFAQQDCLYWTAYFLSKDVFLPPTQKEPEREEVPTPLQVLFSFFTQAPLQPAHARAVSFLIEQALRIAISHGLLSTESEEREDSLQLDIATLIPERIQTTKIEQGENPFSHAVVIPERRSRQLYDLIDGKKNIQELQLLMRVEQKVFWELLQTLVLNSYINVREVNGKIVETPTSSRKTQDASG
jgi:hypothetical protein